MLSAETREEAFENFEPFYTVFFSLLTNLSKVAAFSASVDVSELSF